MSDISAKIQRMKRELENYEAGKPLPISLADIHYLLGACERLLTSVDKVQQTYKKDMEIACAEVEKFRDLYKNARKLSVTVGEKVTKYSQVVLVARRLSWWRKSKELKKELKSLYNLEKMGKSTVPPAAILQPKDSPFEVTRIGDAPE